MDTETILPKFRPCDASNNPNPTCLELYISTSKMWGSSDLYTKSLGYLVADLDGMSKIGYNLILEVGLRLRRL